MIEFYSLFNNFNHFKTKPAVCVSKFFLLLKNYKIAIKERGSTGINHKYIIIIIIIKT